METKKPRRIVIKEELVAITGDFMLAVILNQFLCWAGYANNLDKLLSEEKRIAEKEGIELNTPLKEGIELNTPLKEGWIYKKAEELIEETMLGIAKTSMRNKVKLLVEMGYLFERSNPNYRWDHTKQYRVNFQKIKNDLKGGN